MKTNTFAYWNRSYPEILTLYMDYFCFFVDEPENSGAHNGNIKHIRHYYED